MTRKTRNTESAADSAAAKAPATSVAPRQTKASLLRQMISAPAGASLKQLMESTGWQAHTIRAALTGLRKKGLTIERRREGDETFYEVRNASAKGTKPAARAGS